MNKLSNPQIKLNERNYVELPLLDLQAQQTLGETHRSNLTEVLAWPMRGW